MAGFTAPGTPDTQPPLQVDDFWPALDPEAIRQHMRLNAAINNPVLRHAIVLAVITVNGALSTWAAPYRRAGHTRLADIPAAIVDGQSQLVLLYQRAVTCTAAADLYERTRSFDATGSGHQHAEAIAPGIDEMRRDACWAIRDIKGQTRTTVELI